MYLKNKFNIRDKGLRILELKDFFLKYTDEGNELGINDIVEKFSNYMTEKYGYNFEVTDETLISDIKLLNTYGFEIIINENKYGKKTYSNQSKLFDKHEILLIMNAIASSKFLSEEETITIKEKLSSTVTENFQTKLTNFQKINKGLKTKNNKVKYSLFNINAAIEKNKTITFIYNNYYIKNDRICIKPRHNGKVYEVEPYGLALSSNKCYLIAKDVHNEGKVKHFRVDLLEKVEVGDEEINQNKDFDLQLYLDRSFNMHGEGPTEKVKFKISKEIVNNIVDYFGREVKIEEIDEDYFIIEKKLYINSGLVSWIIKFGEKVEVIEPKILRDQLKEKMKKIYSIYFNSVE